MSTSSMCFYGEISKLSLNCHQIHTLSVPLVIGANLFKLGHRPLGLLEIGGLPDMSIAQNRLELAFVSSWMKVSQSHKQFLDMTSEV